MNTSLDIKNPTLRYVWCSEKVSGIRSRLKTLHSLEILFRFLAIVLLQCSEQQPFSYSVILWKWMNSQVEGKTKNELCATDNTTKVRTMVHVVSAECGNGALVDNDDDWHETKSSEFEREVVSLLQVVITVGWSVNSWNFFSMTDHSLRVFSLSLDTRGKKRALSSQFIKKKKNPQQRAAFLPCQACLYLLYIFLIILGFE